MQNSLIVSLYVAECANQCCRKQRDQSNKPDHACFNQRGNVCAFRRGQIERDRAAAERARGFGEERRVVQTETE